MSKQAENKIIFENFLKVRDYNNIKTKIESTGEECTVLYEDYANNIDQYTDLQMGALQEAAKFYAERGLIPHLLAGGDHPTAPGKAPIRNGWNTRKEPTNKPDIDFPILDIEAEFNNIGLLCGRNSDLMVLDIDCKIKGICECLFKGIDMSDFVISSHTDGRFHIYFKYSDKIKAHQYQTLGFDILSDEVDKKDGKIKGNNVVAPPSRHFGDMHFYRFNKDPALRNEIPEIMIARINLLIEILDKIIETKNKCRLWFKEAFKALFENKKHPLYHDSSIFHQSTEGRNRCLHMLGEMKANGATENELTLMCILMYQDTFDQTQTAKELQHVKPITAKLDTLSQDEYFGEFAKKQQSLNKNGKIRTDDISERENGTRIQPSDLDHTSTRNAAFHFIANEYLSEHTIITVSQNLFIYRNGVYQNDANAEAIAKQDIMDLALKYSVYLTDSQIKSILKIISIKTRKDMKECEPDARYVIVFNNGVLNTRTWEFREHDPSRIYFSKSPVDYIPDAPVPVMFKKYLETTFAGIPNEEKKAQEIAGYTLCRHYAYQYIFYLLGPGGNGKGVYTRLLAAILGEENIKAFSPQELTTDKNAEYKIAQLLGAFANITGDVGKGTILNTENLKKLSGGDPVMGRHPCGRPFQFSSFATLIFAMNQMPKKTSNTRGEKRRDVIVNFSNIIGTTKDDIKDLDQKIIEAGELPGVVNWAIEGLKRLHHNNDFTTIGSVEERAEEIELKSHPIRYFVDECIDEIDFNERGRLPDYISILEGTPTKEVYEAYQMFAKERGLPETDIRDLQFQIMKECQDIGIDTSTKRRTYKNREKNIDVKITTFTSIKFTDKIRVVVDGIQATINKCKPILQYQKTFQHA